MMIGYDGLQVPLQDLLDHPAAQIGEYDQIRTMVGNLLQSVLIKLPEEEGLVVDVLPIQGGAYDGSGGEPICIYMGDNQNLLLPADKIRAVFA